VAVTRRLIRASPERVFDVLADAGSYGDWVVGSHSIRDADASWPAVGSRFYHRVGVGPLALPDHTEVMELDRPHLLVLRARARPLATARVELRLAPADGGTLVTMREGPADPLSGLVLNPLTSPLIVLRNRESLRRLARLAERGES
jgi:uncharacterized protein YndB with AHSA1/START domain